MHLLFKLMLLFMVLGCGHIICILKISFIYLSSFPPLGGNGPPSAPPSSGAPSGSMSLSGNVPSGSPYTIPPEPTLSQNPLSIMMSRMSKFAMPSSTPLYHDAIKTVASSDDDSPPARSPNLPSVNNNGKLISI